MHTVLALETSCDESAVACVQINKGEITILGSEIASQIDEHSKWGGVVPEIASRSHLEKVPLLLEKVLSNSNIQLENLDAIAATVTPGLNGALLIASVTSRTLAALYDVPFLGVHHLEGHLASIRLTEKPPQLPYLVLLVSGGHTELIKAFSDGTFQRLGRSHDDAAGEAFDKVGRLLGLTYPGGPEIEKLALNGDPFKFSLPKGRVSRKEGGFYPYDFSFSGLKTAMLRLVQSFDANTQNLPREDLAASFEKVVAEVLIERSFRCAKDHEIKNIVLVGGVAANQRLRRMMVESAQKEQLDVHFAPKSFCTDNAAMIGAAALIRLESGTCSSSMELGVSPRWPLDRSDLLYRQKPPF